MRENIKIKTTHLQRSLGGETPEQGQLLENLANMVSEELVTGKYNEIEPFWISRLLIIMAADIARCNYHNDDQSNMGLQSFLAEAFTWPKPTEVAETVN